MIWIQTKISMCNRARLLQFQILHRLQKAKNETPPFIFMFMGLTPPVSGGAQFLRLDRDFARYGRNIWRNSANGPCFFAPYIGHKKKYLYIMDK